MSLSEAPHLEALKPYLKNPKLPTDFEPRWRGNFDSFTTSLLYLFVHGEITAEQAQLILGQGFNLALWERFGDLGEAFSVATGNAAKQIWKEFAAFSEKLTGPDPRQKPYHHQV